MTVSNERNKRTERHERWGWQHNQCSVDGCDRSVWKTDTKHGHGSQHMFDPYSFCHMEVGVMQGFFLSHIGYKANISTHCMWEFVENTPWMINIFRDDPRGLEYTGDSAINSVGDLISFYIGFIIGVTISKSNGRYVRLFAVLAILESIPFMLMRDNSVLLAFKVLKTIVARIG